MKKIVNRELNINGILVVGRRVKKDAELRRIEIGRRMEAEESGEKEKGKI